VAYQREVARAAALRKKRGFPKGGGKPAFEKSIKEKYL
jgi:hypothetical protein